MILATIEVRDDGGNTLRNFRDALADLDQTSQQAAQGVGTMGPAAKASGDALAHMAQDVLKNLDAQRRQVEAYQREQEALTRLTTNRGSYTEQLARARAEYDLLTKAEKEQIAAALQLGKSYTEIATKLGLLSEHTVRLYRQELVEAKRAQDDMGSSAGGLQAQLTGLAQILGAAGLGTVVKKYLEDAFQVAARNEVLSTSMQVVATNAHKSSIEFEMAAARIRELGITTKESREAVLSFAQANLSMADAAKIARAAQDLAVIAGKNSSEAFSTLTTAIQVQQPLLLRQFGILTGLDDLYGQYARSIGKTVQQLDAHEKRQAFINRILTEGEKVAGAYTNSMNDVGKVMGSTARFTEELQNKVGQGLLPVVKSIVVEQNKWLDALAKLPTPILAGATATLTLAAALTTLTLAVKGLLALGIGALFTSTVGAILAVVAAVSLAVGAWTAYSSAVSYNVDQAREEMAALEGTKRSFEEKREAVTKAQQQLDLLRTSGADTADQQRILTKAVDDLAKSFPGVVTWVDKASGSFQVHAAAVAAVEARYTTALEAMRQVAAGEAATAQQEFDKVNNAIVDMQNALSKGADTNFLRDTKAESRDLAISLMSSVDILKLVQARFSNDQAEQGRLYFKALSDAAGSLMATLKELNAVAQEPDVQGMAAAIRTDLEKKFGGQEQVRALLAAARVSWHEYTTATGADLDVLVQKVTGSFEQQQKDLAKWQQAYKTTFDQIADTGATAGARLQAANDALAGAARGSDAYAERLLRAKGVIEAFNKLAPETQAKFKALKQASQDLEQIKLDATLAKWQKKFEELIPAVQQVARTMATEFGRDVTDRIEDSRLTIEDQMTQLDRELLRLDEDLYDRTTGLKLNEVDQKILQNDRYFQSVQRSIDDQIREIERGWEAEQRVIERRQQQAQEQLGDAILAARERFKIEVESETAVQNAKAAIQKASSVEERQREVQRVQEEFATALGEIWTESALAIDRAAQREQAGFQARKQMQQTYIEDFTQAQARLSDANASTNNEILRESSFTYRMLKEQAGGYVDQVLDGFGQMITGAKSFKDIFLGIFNSILQSISGIAKSITNAMVNGLMGIGTETGGWAGARQSLMNTFGKSASGAGSRYLMNALTSSGASLGYGAIGMGASNALVGTQLAAGVPFAGGQFAGYSGALNSGSLAGSGGMLSSMPAWAGLGMYAGAGGLAGYGIGRWTGNKWAGMGGGALAGAGAGAALGSMGGPWGAVGGAVVGGIAGGLFGYVGGAADEKRTKAAREEFIKMAGGLDEITEAAERTGVSLERVLNTKKFKEFEEQVRMLQEAVREADIWGNLETQFGGAEGLREAASRAGFDVTELDSTTPLSADEFDDLVERLGSALELQQAKDNLAQTANQLTDLEKRARMVGFNLQQLWDADNIDTFNAGLNRMNQLFAEQETRLQGLQTAAGGLQQRVDGLTIKLNQGIEDFLQGLSKADRETLDTNLSKAQDEGFQGGVVSLLQEGRGGIAITEEQAGTVNTLLQNVRTEFRQVGLYAQAIFAATLKETGDLLAATEAVAGPLDDLLAIQDEIGVAVDEGLAKLLTMRQVARDNQDVVQALSGIRNMIIGLGDASALTQDLFNAFGHDAATQMATLQERGVAADQVLIQMQPTLQALYNAQKNFGFAADEATQALINQGVEAGIVGEEGRETNQRMLDVLLLIADALGADLPEAMQSWRDRMREVTDEVKEIGDGASDVGDVTGSARDASDQFHDMQQQIDGARGAIANLAAQAVPQLHEISEAANAVSLGSSPGGLKEIPIQAERAQAAVADMAVSMVADLNTVERSIPREQGGGAIQRVESQVKAAAKAAIDLSEYLKEYQSILVGRIKDPFERERAGLRQQFEERLAEVKKTHKVESAAYQQHYQALAYLYNMYLEDIKTREQEAAAEEAKQRAEQHAQAMTALHRELGQTQRAMDPDSWANRGVQLQIDLHQRLVDLQTALGAETAEYQQQAAVIQQIYAQLFANLEQQRAEQFASMRRGLTEELQGLEVSLMEDGLARNRLALQRERESRLAELRRTLEGETAEYAVQSALILQIYALRDQQLVLQERERVQGIARNAGAALAQRLTAFRDTLNRTAGDEFQQLNDYYTAEYNRLESLGNMREEMERLRQEQATRTHELLVSQAQEQEGAFQRLALIATGTFAQMLNAGVPVTEIFSQIGEALANITALGEEMGFEVPAAAQALFRQGQVVQENQDLFTGAQASSDLLKALREGQLLTPDLRNAVAEDIFAQYQSLLERGTSEQDALQLFAPFLQQLRGIREQFGGFQSGDLEALLAQAEMFGVIGPHMATLEEQQVVLLEEIRTLLAIWTGQTPEGVLPPGAQAAEDPPLRETQTLAALNAITTAAGGTTTVQIVLDGRIVAETVIEKMPELLHLFAGNQG